MRYIYLECDICGVSAKYQYKRTGFGVNHPMLKWGISQLSKYDEAVYCPECQAQEEDWQEQISQTTLWQDIEKLKEDGHLSW